MLSIWQLQRQEKEMNKYQELLQVIEKEHQVACEEAGIEETARAKVYFQLLGNLADKETSKKPVVIQDDIFGDYHLVCPNCGQGAIVIATRNDGKLYPRCPFCGQKLREEEENV